MFWDNRKIISKMYNRNEIIKEREKLYPDFMSEDSQQAFRDYRKNVIDKSLSEPNIGNEISFGFNACLKMMAVATNIDWKQVKWNDLNASMTSWYSAACETQIREQRVKALQKLQDNKRK